MLRQLRGKIIEALISVLPVTLIVILLNLTPLVDFSAKEIGVFCFSAFLLLIGIGLFNLGADLAMTPMGKYVGEGLTRSGKLMILLIVCFAMGVLITVAEPDLTVLASQVSNIINATTLILFVGVGVGIFLVIALFKIVFKVPLSSLLMLFYFLLFALTSILIIEGKGEMLALAFDSGGVTTGPITVPFIMALGVGIAMTIGGRNASENSFGLIALCSVGPILAVMILGICSKGNLTYAIPDYTIADNVMLAFITTFGTVTKEVLLALGLIVVFFFIINFIFLKISMKRIKQILFGILFTFLGLVIFLTSVNVGFMPIGYKMGSDLAKYNSNLLIVVGFVLGLVVVLAEPAVHVLNKQVEEITSGGVSKKSMLIALAVGVGISVCLSMIRIKYDFSLLYYLLPGYFVSLGLSLFVPKMYTAIAFDSGGVASGPLTSTFILPFAIGACVAIYPDGSKVLTDAFGIVAMVAMTPLITIQCLGFSSIVKRAAREKRAMRRLMTAEDKQIIEFM
ncbi:MAG: DUF1538 domain-containing protein [Lachnospiraceae bacterium]|nr:DUF1538 domain-containing protein [Lachnospiraceae bacterium]